MTKGKIILFLVLIILIILVFTPEKITIIYQNSIEAKVINIELFLDGKKIENKEVAYSYPFPREMTYLNVSIGYHVIKIKCEELKIEKSIKVFSLFKNNVEFEFTGNAANGFTIIERKSWFPLLYE